jgi:cytochrome c-type biogenesis protein CcmH/NrfG
MIKVHPQRAAAVVLVAWVAGLGALSVGRLPDWRNERALWTATVRTASASPRAHHNLAGVLAEAGEVRRASRHLRRALRLDPDYVPSLVGLATIACSRGKQGSAVVLAARARMRGGDASALAEIEAGCPPDARDR